MSDKSNNSLPDPLDRDALEKWLHHKSRSKVIVFCASVALLGLPGVATLQGSTLRSNSGRNLLLASLRAICLARWTGIQLDQATVDSARFSASASRNAAYAIYDKAYSEAAESAVEFGYAASAAAEAALSALQEDGFNAATAAATASRSIDTIAAFGGLPKNSMQIVVSILERMENSSAAVSSIAQYAKDATKLEAEPLSEILARTKGLRGAVPPGENWEIWLDWAESRFRGELDWPKPVYDELTKWRLEWDRDPALVNAEIKVMLQKHSERQSSNRWDFFLSYAAKNEGTARWIAEIVQQSGRTVYIHSLDGSSAEAIVSKTKKALNNSERMIALLSPAYFGSRWRRDEWDYFYHREANEHRDLIIQFKLHGDIPWPFARAKPWHSLLGRSAQEQRSIVLAAIGAEDREIAKPPSDPLPKPGPTSRMAVRNGILDFATVSDWPDSEAGPYFAEQAKQLTEKLLQSNTGVPPDIKAALNKLRTLLSKPLAEIPAYELRVAAVAISARLDAFAKVDLDSISGPSLGALTELNFVLRDLQATVLKQMQSNAEAIRVLELDGEKISAANRAAQFVNDVFATSSSVSDDVKVAVDQTVHIATVVESEIARKTATGNLVLQIGESGRAIAAELSDARQKSPSSDSDGTESQKHASSEEDREVWLGAQQIVENDENKGQDHKRRQELKKYLKDNLPPLGVNLIASLIFFVAQSFPEIGIPGMAVIAGWIGYEVYGRKAKPPKNDPPPIDAPKKEGRKMDDQVSEPKLNIPQLKGVRAGPRAKPKSSTDNPGQRAGPKKRRKWIGWVPSFVRG